MTAASFRLWAAGLALRVNTLSSEAFGNLGACLLNITEPAKRDAGVSGMNGEANLRLLLLLMMRSPSPSAEDDARPAAPWLVQWSEAQLLPFDDRVGDDKRIRHCLKSL
eukprot:scaffold183818_cov20-Prasinocladus_malaysianus.AAC.1